MVMAFVSIVHSITSLPEEFRTAMEILSLCTSMPIYFLLSIEGAPFCCGFGAEHSKPTPRGAPFYIASRNRTCAQNPFRARNPHPLGLSELLKIRLPKSALEPTSKRTVFGQLPLQVIEGIEMARRVALFSDLTQSSERLTTETDLSGKSVYQMG